MIWYAMVLDGVYGFVLVESGFRNSGKWKTRFHAVHVLID